MRAAAAALALLGLALLAAECSAARLFDHRHPLKREIGRRRRGKDGKVRGKEVDVDLIGRAHFDPSYAHEDELTHEDLGLDDLHEPTDSVIEHRLRQLFPSIDLNHDGTVSTDELQRHLFVNGLATAHRRADAEFKDTDTNHDGKVTAQEYLASILDTHTEEGKKTLQDVYKGLFPDPLDYGSYTDLTRAAMIYADVDHDGGLNHPEFFDFLNPEEGTNVNLKLHRLRQDVFDHLEDREHYHHPDQLVLHFEEFYKNLWPQFTVWETHAEDEHWNEEKEKANAQRKFVLLDTNADHLLTPEELLPAYADLHPTENRYARMQAEHMMDMADCKDDKLTLLQMLTVPHAFYGAMHDEGHTEL